MTEARTVSDAAPTAPAARRHGWTSYATPERVQPDRRGDTPARLAYLFAVVLRGPGDRPYTAAEVGRWIRDHGETDMTGQYIGKILAGDRPGPSVRYLRDLAAFFGVSAHRFIDDIPPPLEGEQLETLMLDIRMRSDDTRSLVTCIGELSPNDRDAIDAVVDRLLDTEARPPRTALIRPDEDTVPIPRSLPFRVTELSPASQAAVSKLVRHLLAVASSSSDSHEGNDVGLRDPLG